MRKKRLLSYFVYIVIMGIAFFDLVFARGLEIENRISISLDKGEMVAIDYFAKSPKAKGCLVGRVLLIMLIIPLLYLYKKENNFNRFRVKFPAACCGT